MNFIATVVERVLAAITWVAMHVVIVSERWRRRLPRRLRRLSGSVRRIWRRWVESLGVTPVAKSGLCNADPELCGAACGGACVDLATDGDNCGECGRKCSTGQTCNAGSCCFECRCPDG